MSVVPIVQKEQAEPAALVAYEDLENRIGFVFDAFKVLAHKPSSVMPVWELHKILMLEGVLDPALREIAVIKICSLNQTLY